MDAVVWCKILVHTLTAKTSMKHLVNELLKMFVDETPLSYDEFQFLAENGFIDEIELGAWQLTDLGRQTLKNQT